MSRLPLHSSYLLRGSELETFLLSEIANISGSTAYIAADTALSSSISGTISQVSSSISSSYVASDVEISSSLVEGFTAADTALSSSISGTISQVSSSISGSITNLSSSMEATIYSAATGSFTSANSAQLDRLKYLNIENPLFLYDFQDGSGTTVTNHSENASVSGYSGSITSSASPATASAPPVWDNSQQLFGSYCITNGTGSDTQMDGYVEIGYSDEIIFDDNGLGQGRSWEIGFWYKCSSTGSLDHWIVSKTVDGSYESGAKLFAILSDGTPHINYFGGSLTGTAVLRDNVWHKVVMNYSHTNNIAQIVVDGVLDKIGAYTPSADNAGDVTRAIHASSEQYYVQGLYYKTLSIV